MIYLQNNSYNVSVAKVFGILTAVFLGCIDNERAHQSRTGTLTEKGFLSLTRKEIYERTGMEDKKQEEVENSLKECGVLIVKHVTNASNKLYYLIDEEKLQQIMTVGDPSEVIGQLLAKEHLQEMRVDQPSKRQDHINMLKRKVNCTDPVVQQYMVDWIDTIYSSPRGYLSSTGVILNMQILENYAPNDPSTQIAILKIAIVGGLKDFSWAIERYEKQNNIDGINFCKYENISVGATGLSADGEVY